MLVCQYSVGYDSQRALRGIGVFNVVLDGTAVVCCDLDRRVDGVSLVIGLAFNEDLDLDPDTPPCEWVMLPDLAPAVVVALEGGQSVPLIEETTGLSHMIRLEEVQGLAI